MDKIEIIISIVSAVLSTIIAGSTIMWAMLKYGFRIEEMRSDIASLKDKVDVMDTRLTRVETKVERLPIIEAAIAKIPKIEAQVKAHDNSPHSHKNFLKKSKEETF